LRRRSSGGRCAPCASGWRGLRCVQPSALAAYSGLRALHLPETRIRFDLREPPAGSPAELDVGPWRAARLSAARGSVMRPCEPDDVVKCLDRLYRQRRIELAHARILRLWGERGTAPNPRIPAERGDLRLWREAMERLDFPLRQKGIVAGPPRGMTPPAEGAAVIPFPGARAEMPA
jgi:hypothetical protein